jgi:hypothetical protein
MPGRKKDPTKKIGEISQSFLTNALNFFTSVLKSIATDDFLRVIWGVEVLLFLILAFMILFGNITGDQRFNLALVIIASVVFVLTLSAWRSRGQWGLTPAVPPIESGPSVALQPSLIGPMQKCLVLLTQIDKANERIIDRGRSGSGPWARMLNDTYNHVCDTCHRRRLGTQPADAYFDAICPDPDLTTVCKKKWELGEALDDYRKQMTGVSPIPRDHDELEVQIRRSVTLPDWRPLELETALRAAIERAKRIRS